MRVIALFDSLVAELAIAGTEIDALQTTVEATRQQSRLKQRVIVSVPFVLIDQLLPVPLK